MRSKLDKILAGVKTYTKIIGEEQDRAISLRFGEADFGFGEICIRQDDKGQVFVDSERTSAEHTVRIIGRLLDGAIFDWEQDPVKHKKYNQVMGIVACGCGCGFIKGKRKAR